MTPEQIRDILLQLLNVLDYLESLSPPVVHRDIKPSNIVIDVADDVKVNLVDFGAVVENIHGSRMGSTMIGTFGYMAPEQFSGVANAATDLYGNVKVHPTPPRRKIDFELTTLIFHRDRTGCNHGLPPHAAGTRIIASAAFENGF